MDVAYHSVSSNGVSAFVIIVTREASLRGSPHWHIVVLNVSISHVIRDTPFISGESFHAVLYAMC